MLIEDVPKRDFTQIFQGVVVKDLICNDWCFIKEFDGNFAYIQHYLNKGGYSGDLMEREFTDEHFSLATPSLGMCNTRNGAFFLQRRPSRVMKGGVVLDSLTSKPVRVIRDSQGHALRFEKSYSKLKHMFNKEYPTLAEAYVAAKEVNRTIAFDRQFAVCWDGKIYYKANHSVGVVVEGTSGLFIAWDPEFQLLENVLGDNCEKSLYATKQAPKTRNVGGGSGSGSIEGVVAEAW